MNLLWPAYCDLYTTIMLVTSSNIRITKATRHIAGQVDDARVLPSHGQHPSLHSLQTLASLQFLHKRICLLHVMGQSDTIGVYYPTRQGLLHVMGQSDTIGVYSATRQGLLHVMGQSDTIGVYSPTRQGLLHVMGQSDTVGVYSPTRQGLLHVMGQSDTIGVYSPTRQGLLHVMGSRTRLVFTLPQDKVFFM